MLIQTVYLQLAEDHRTVDARARVANETRAALSGLPHLRGMHVAVPADEASSKGWDLALHLRFDDADGVAAFEGVSAFLAWRREAPVNFEKKWVWEIL